MVITNSGIAIMETKPHIVTSNGKMYQIMNNMLICSNTGEVISNNVHSWEEALWCIVGLYGGKRI